ncbi:hypothetical protein cypCar_00041652 [Cyprinus carpio]|nr:hypothetical protein cypCar_00041652 [Cyprinus carpio]
MLDSLTLLFEKFFLFSNFNIFKSLWQEEPERAVKWPVLRRGDLLEVQRTLFIHYGIYLGDNRVAHLMPDIMPVLTNNKQLIKPVVTNKRLILGCIYRNASIRVDSVEDFAYGAQIMVNDMDMKMKCQPLFCDCLKTIIRDQRSVALTAGIGVMYILCFGLAPSTTLPTILIPFILWMAG